MSSLWLVDVLLAVIAFIAGAIAHESDMARNFKKYGDAKCWIFEIKKGDPK